MAKKRVILDENKQQCFPITHISAVIDAYGNTIENIIQQMSENLVNLYYTKGEVDLLIDNLEFGIIKKVDALPVVGEEHIIYLVPKEAPATGFDEWIWMADENRFELIGDTNIDLSDYYTKSEVDTKVSAETTRATTAENNLDTTKANKSEMTVVAGTGANADKTTITLKSGTSATVLTQHQDISGKEDKVGVVNVASGTASVNAQVGKYYSIAGNVGTLAITLPTITTTNKLQSLMLSFETSDSPSVTITAGAEITYFEDYYIQPNTKYEINMIWNGTKWIVAYGVIV